MFLVKTCDICKNNSFYCVVCAVYNGINTYAMWYINELFKYSSDNNDIIYL